MRALTALLAAAVLAGPAHAACVQKHASQAYTRSVESALASRRDVWGEALLRAPGGPSYEAARRYLAPLLLVGRLTASGVYYLPFGEPGGPLALHVADGSRIVSRRAGGPSTALVVDGEVYGSCLSVLATPSLADGWLPILETHYRDLRQESFAVGSPPTSYVRLTLPRPAHVRFGPLRATASGAVYFARPLSGEPRRVDAEAYEAAKQELVADWERRLSEGITFVVPERRVLDAERNLLVQNLLLGWRYSVGNAYESFEFPESLDTAEVMAEYGFGSVARSIVEASLRREPRLYPAWEAGERLLAAARYAQLSGDAGLLPALAPQVARLARLDARGLEPPELYASDLPTRAYGFANQAVAWQGLREYAAAAHDAAAARAAARLARGLRRALAASERRLPDGSLFVPARLLAGEAPYEDVTATRAGSYWNLVVPHALAAGFLSPAAGSGVLAYLQRHGSRLLGLVRFDGRRPDLPGYAAPGSDDVYELNLVRFLADLDRPDELALALYGQLAAGMTAGTFVSGEGATIAPVGRAWYRSMYLPPNGTSNAAFLETLRLALVHETATGLELAFGTPRAWLAPGKRIAVTQAPTRFGRVSYAIDATATSAHVELDAPPVRTLRLRLRRPIASVLVDGRPYRRFAGQTIDLSGLSGAHTVDAAWG